jgi:hypothetical protein
MERRQRAGADATAFRTLFTTPMTSSTRSSTAALTRTGLVAPPAAALLSLLLLQVVSVAGQGAAADVGVDRACYSLGQDLRVTYSGAAEADDWIAILPADSNDDNNEDFVPPPSIREDDVSGNERHGRRAQPSPPSRCLRGPARPRCGSRALPNFCRVARVYGR